MLTQSEIWNRYVEAVAQTLDSWVAVPDTIRSASEMHFTDF